MMINLNLILTEYFDKKLNLKYQINYNKRLFFIVHKLSYNIITNTIFFMNNILL